MTDAWLSSLPWGTIGPSTLVSIFVMLLFTGKLLPASRVNKEEQRLVDEANNWRTAAITEQKRADQSVQLMERLLEAAKTQEALLRELGPG